VTADPVFDETDRGVRLGANHHLANRAGAASVVSAANDLVGLHASDPMTVYLSAWARVPEFQSGDLDRALYDDRSLLKILGMRRTMFVVPVELASVIQAACTDSIAKGERTRLHRMIEAAGIAKDPEEWLHGVETETLAVLEAKGAATAAELTKEVAGLRARIPFGAGKKWVGEVGVSTRLLFLLASEGRIIRGRPKGGITSSLYRWSLIEQWVPGGLPTMPKAAAQAELVRRYLASYGPATIADVAWWTGWTMNETRTALRESGSFEVEIEAGAGRPGFILPGGQPAAMARAEPWVALLPALDPAVMGWQRRDWYLGEHKARLFDRNGNAGPSIWADGRIVGGWAQRGDGEIALRFLEPVKAGTRRLAQEKAADLQAWLGPIRFVPRFRTPLEQELVSEP
jgi:winged helix DNA-binding protein